MKFIKVESIINAPLSKVWNYWTNEAHIINATSRLANDFG
jgi:uncharacterized protein YndB with AHSA1/START domain